MGVPPWASAGHTDPVTSVSGPAVEVRTSADGSVVIHPCGVIDWDGAVALRQLLVHTVRKVRPARLVLDLADVAGLDPINVGTLSAACELGDDHHVVVFLDNAAPDDAARLTAAGVPRHRLRCARPGPPGDVEL